MSRTRPDGEKRGVGPGVALLFIAGILFLLFLPFLPLLLAFVEAMTLGTGHVEEFCKSIGIHDLLTALYRPILDFVMSMFL